MTADKPTVLIAAVQLNVFAQIAQSVEQRTENPCVGGSIPPLGTISSDRLATLAVENLRRYANGEPLLNVVDMDLGY